MSRFITLLAACLLIQVSFGAPPTASAEEKVVPKPRRGALGQVQGQGLAQVLVVADVDKPNGRILFESWRTVKQELPLGRREFIDVAEPVTVAFSLKDWEAITADGKEVKGAELWKRIKVGKPVVILSPATRDRDEKLPKEIRALFKDDCILLVAATKPLPKEKAQTPPIEDPKKSPAKPKLLVKEAAYLIHAVPTKGLAIVHTTMATGEMKLLASGDYSAFMFPSGTGGSAQPIFVDFDVRIAGVAVDKERLYVLRWDNNRQSSNFRLLVFRPQDGKLIATADLKGDGVPRDAPKVSADNGSLRLHDNGVSCFGTRFEFKGTELIKQSPEKRP